MINFNDEFTLIFSLGTVSDFISNVNLLEFNLYETAGNVRPTIDIKFKLENEELVKYLNPGNILTLSFGKKEPLKDALQFELTGDDTQIQYTLGYVVQLRGAFYKPGFTSKVGYDFFKEKRSYEVIKQIAQENGFTFKSNVVKTDDKQNWYRESTTLWSFMKYVWLHSYLNDDTFFAYGMDCDSIYFYDMRKHTANGAKWIVTNLTDAGNAKSLIAIGSYQVSNRYGDVADLVGRNLQISVYDVDKGMLELQSYKLKSFTTVDTNKLNINATNSLDYSYGIISEDVHTNFVKAYDQNVRNNLMYQSFEVYAVTGGTLGKYHLMDAVSFNVTPYDIRLQGLAFITSIAYKYTPGNLITTLTFSKEAPSGIKGSDLSVAG